MVDLIQSQLIAEGLMIGPDNAAWYPCNYAGRSTAEDPTTGAAGWRNEGTTDGFWMFFLPLPCDKGNLSLRIKGIKVCVGDADANDYVDSVTVYTTTYAGASAIYTDGTNMTSAKDWVSGGDLGAWGAATDCTGKDMVVIHVQVQLTTQYELDLFGVLLQCYYDY